MSRVLIDFFFPPPLSDKNILDRERRRIKLDYTRGAAFSATLQGESSLSVSQPLSMVQADAAKPKSALQQCSTSSVLLVPPQKKTHEEINSSYRGCAHK